MTIDNSAIDNNLTVCKFGGSSVANATQISKVENIIKEDERRRFVVVSAPGKDEQFKHKVTDILYNLYYSVDKSDKSDSNYEVIDGNTDIFQDMLVHRFESITKSLGISNKVVNELKNKIDAKNVLDNYVERTVALGEYFSAKIMAEYLNADFVDAAVLIMMKQDGSVMMHSTFENMSKLSSNKNITIIPGFYGSLFCSTEILTFSRGGSDLTGSLVAAGVGAKLYENWTDRDGIYACDPRLFDNGELKGRGLFVIPVMSYKETRELTYMGFEIFNDESIGPLLEKKIPLVIKNTNNPSAPGTFISEEYDKSRPVRGIAGKNGFCSINVEKYMMNKTVGFGAALLSILSGYGINYEHSPTGIDSMTVVLEQKPFEKHRRNILNDINNKLSPDNISVKENLGLVAVVGEGMNGNCNISSNIMSVLSKNNIQTKIINQGASENNIIFGINTDDYKRAIKSLYGALIEMR
jgi:aspartate kinase